MWTLILYPGWNVGSLYREILAKFRNSFASRAHWPLALLGSAYGQGMGGKSRSDGIVIPGLVNLSLLDQRLPKMQTSFITFGSVQLIGTTEAVL